MGDSNYFHWMTEILPKLEFTATSDGFYKCRHIIASSRVREINAFQKVFKRALKGFDFVAHYLEPNLNYHIQTLFVVNMPSHILFNSIDILSIVDFNFYRKTSLDYD
jgi:hypothetical protein